MNYKTKRTLMYIGMVLLVVAVIALLVTLVGNKANKNDNGDYTKLKPTWYVGALEGGSFDKNEVRSMVTGYIDINEGLKFEISEDKKVTYYLTVYDEDNNYLGEFRNGAPFDTNNTFTLADFTAQYEKAARIRLEICDMTGDDSSIGRFEKGKYSKVISVFTTTKEQKITDAD